MVYIQGKVEETQGEKKMSRRKCRVLIPCPGEAHKNPHVDNCSLCAPRWGQIEVDADIANPCLHPGCEAGVGQPCYEIPIRQIAIKYRLGTSYGPARLSNPHQNRIPTVRILP